MARLLIMSDGFGKQVIELHLGVNRFGPGKDNDFQIEHATISARRMGANLTMRSVMEKKRWSWTPFLNRLWHAAADYGNSRKATLEIKRRILRRLKARLKEENYSPPNVT